MVLAPSRLRARPQIENRSLRARRSQPPISYNEDSSDGETANLRAKQTPQPDAEPAMATQRASQRKRAKIVETPPATRSPDKIARNRQPKSGAERSNNRKYAKQDARASANEVQIPIAFLTGKKMPWQTLPFHVLTSIFAYASSPILSNKPNPRPSVKWLVQIARLCKSFTEPAFSVLYFALSILEPSQLRQLVSLLRSESDMSLVKYRHKIRHIYIPYPAMWAGKTTNNKFSDLAEMIKFTPKLRGIHLDMQPRSGQYYHCQPLPRSTPSRTGEPEILTILQESNVALEAWTWNFQVDEASFGFAAVERFQRAGLFRRLKSITISNVCSNKSTFIHDLFVGRLPVRVLTDTIQSISSLNQVCLSNVQCVCDTLVPGLPDGLKSLIIVNCPLLRSPDIHAYLTTKGRHLEELVLDHNQSLALSFLTDLSWACPRLKTFEMDLLFHGPYTVTHNSNPEFKSLLLPDERPSWPLSIQRIELLHLRRWETPVADSFFLSLAENAGLLLELRHLKIKASLYESSWRNRVAFRDKWVTLLEKLYLRRLDFSSDQSERVAQAVEPKDAHQNRRISHSRRGREGNVITEIPLPSQAPVKSPISRKRRSLRKHKAADYNESSSEVEDSAFEDDAAPQNSDEVRGSTFHGQQNGEEPTFIVQGLCDVVDIVIDNLRPTEEQLHESDFLDEEFSGDEDWNANNDIAMYF